MTFKIWKEWGSLFIFLLFLFFSFRRQHCILFVIIYGNLLKYIVGTAQIFAMKIAHSATLKYSHTNKTYL